MWTASGTAVFGFMPVVSMLIVSAFLMIVVSLLTTKTHRTILDEYFSKVLGARAVLHEILRKGVMPLLAV